MLSMEVKWHVASTNISMTTPLMTLHYCIILESFIMYVGACVVRNGIIIGPYKGQEKMRLLLQ